MENNALRYIKLADHLLSEYKGLRDVKGIERETILSPEAKILDHKPAVLMSDVESDRISNFYEQELTDIFME